MVEASTIAAIRFGYGFSPNEVAPRGKSDLLAQLGNTRAPLSGVGFSSKDSFKYLMDDRAIKRASRMDTVRSKAVKNSRRILGTARSNIIRQRVLDTMRPNAGFQERLVSFWANHFSVSARKSKPSSLFVGVYLEEAIRPNIATSFSQLLRAAITHPTMLDYLDQRISVGPNSKVGRKKDKGLNENLARELLELHTLGVGGAYRQADVRQLAELLTGLTFRLKPGFVYDKKLAEPGAETVLGKTYGGKAESLQHIYAFLDDVANHPDTAKHIAQKLVVHFVSDTPSEGLVRHVAEVFSQTKGDLMSVYEALLEHDDAWIPLGGKIKWPFDYVVSGLRACGVSRSEIEKLSKRELRQFISAPLSLMGQRFMSPLGPDGWSEDAQHWITPQGLAGRIQWATFIAREMAGRIDPRDLLDVALRDLASPALKLAVSRAQVDHEGLTLVLASPEFNRR